MAKRNAPKLLTEHSDFMSELDWRWIRALALYTDAERPVPGFDDKYVVRALKYLEAFENATTLSQQQLLRQKFGREVRAVGYHLHEDKRRFRLQALSLCRDLPKREMARLLGTGTDIIDTYEKFFFDVREKDPAALFMQIFSPGAVESMTNPNDSDLVWKYIALTGGYKVYKEFTIDCAGDDVTNKMFIDIGDSHVAKLYALAAMTRNARSNQDKALAVESGLKLKELMIREREGAGGGVHEAVATILSACTESFCVSVTDPNRTYPTGYEPTIEEMLLAEPESAAAVYKNHIEMPKEAVEVL